MGAASDGSAGGRERVPFQVVFDDSSSDMELYARRHGRVVLEGQHLKPTAPRTNTALVFMHPAGLMNLLPLPNALARAGVPVVTSGSRYPWNDSALIMEKVVVDLGRVIAYAKERLGYEKIVLAGWSGGGSLSLFYQSQAESPTVTATPAGDPVDLTRADLPPADGMMQLAAHVSRAKTFTEWLDPSIQDENDPYTRDPDLDLYNPANPHQPPYAPAYLERFHAAQIARNRRITAWVREQLEDVVRRQGPHGERGFVTHCTMAAPCWLDPTVDPNDRTPGQCYLGEPRAVNNGPAGLGRFSTLRSWLSQWSYDDSNADGPTHAGRISVPTLVVENSADDACLPSHAARIFAALAPEDKEKHTIKGATHYYLGQRDKLAEATDLCIDWLARKSLLD